MHGSVVEWIHIESRVQQPLRVGGIPPKTTGTLLQYAYNKNSKAPNLIQILKHVLLRN